MFDDHDFWMDDFLEADDDDVCVCRFCGEVYLITDPVAYDRSHCSTLCRDSAAVVAQIEEVAS